MIHVVRKWSTNALLARRLSSRACRYLPSIINQVAFVLTQGLVLGCLYRALGVIALDEAFLALALVTPVYVLLLLGGRQLYASEVLNYNSFIRVRLGSVVVFAVACVGIWWLLMRDLVSTQLVAFVVAWKVQDMSQDALGIVVQKRELPTLLIAISLARVLLILPAYFVKSETSITMLTCLFIATAGLTFVALMRRRGPLDRIGHVMLTRGLSLGVAATAAALTVSVPRIALGKYVGAGTGVVAFVGIASYVYLIGQIVISALAPHVISRALNVRMSARPRFVWNIIRSSALLYLLIIALAGVGFVLVAIQHEFLWDFSYLFAAVLLFVYVGLIGNTAEAMVSVVGAERVAAIASVLAFLMSSIAAIVFVPRWGAFGYCASLLAAFILRFVVLSSRFRGGAD